MARKRSVMCHCPLQQHHLLPLGGSCCRVGGEASTAALLQRRLGAMPVAGLLSNTASSRGNARAVSRGEWKVKKSSYRRRSTRSAK